ncbi:MAG: hypothetical protein ACRDGQ_03870, partial [Candidatus Limnocylindrales bacterium]
LTATTAYSGTYSVQTPANASTGIGTASGSVDGYVSLNAYRNAGFAVKADTATGAGIDFKIYDKTTGASAWFVYVVGTPFTTSFAHANLSGSITGVWR